MKKNITQLFILASLFVLNSALTAQSVGERFQLNGLFYEVTNTSPMEVSAVPELGNWPFWKDTPMPEGDIVIPATVTNGGHTYAVTAVGEALFYQCADLTSSVLPASITSIGDMAYQSCNKLTKITIPDGVTSIGSSAFNVCASLSAVTLPTSLTSIGASAFYKTKLTEVVIPNSVISIGNLAFSNCPDLTTVMIPKSVESIGTSAFSKSQKLHTVHLSEGLKTIGNSAFGECDGLTAIEIPNSTTTIGETAFEYCVNLKTVTIPKSLTSIGAWAFADCGALERVDSYVEDLSAVSLSQGIFEGASLSTCVLNVPKGKLGQYQAAEQWKDFGTIQERSSTDVRDAVVDNNTLSISVIKGRLSVSIPNLSKIRDRQISLVNLLGRTVDTRSVSHRVVFDTTDLAEGVYLVKVGNFIQKVVVK